MIGLCAENCQNLFGNSINRDVLDTTRAALNPAGLRVPRMITCRVTGSEDGERRRARGGRDMARP